MAVYKCPVCEGRGKVRGNFYEVPGETVSVERWVEMGKNSAACESCWGRGVILTAGDQPSAPAYCTPVVFPPNKNEEQDDPGENNEEGRWAVGPATYTGEPGNGFTPGKVYYYFGGVVVDDYGKPRPNPGPVEPVREGSSWFKLEWEKVTE